MAAARRRGGRPFSGSVRRPARERPGPAGAGRLPVRRHLQIHRRRRNAGRASTASIRGPCTSARSASIPATTSTSTCWASALHRSSDGGKTFTDRRPARASMPTSTPCGSTRGRPAHDRRLRRRLLRHLRPLTNWDHLNQRGHRPVLSRRRRQAAAVPGLWRLAGQRQLGRPELGPHTGAGPVNEDWISVGGGDGFVCRVDPNDPDLDLLRQPGRRHGPAQPAHRRRARRSVWRGQAVAMAAAAAAAARSYRFNWNTPFILSQPQLRRSSTARGNFVFRSLDQGNDLQIISPEITRTKRGTRHGPRRVAAQSRRALGRHRRRLPVGHAATAARSGPTSPRRSACPGRAGLPPSSRRATPKAGRYVAFDGHRSDDDEPYVYVTEDFGQTWKSLRGQPADRARRAVCARTSRTRTCSSWARSSRVWASLDRGKTWTKINSNLPTVAVHEFAIHPTAGEIVAPRTAAALWILDSRPCGRSPGHAQGRGSPVQADGRHPLAQGPKPRPQRRQFVGETRAGHDHLLLPAKAGE